MNRKHLVAGLSVLLAVLVGALWLWNREGERGKVPPLGELPNSLARLVHLAPAPKQYNDRLLKELSDLQNPPPPLQPLVNEEQLRELVDRITSLNFPECELAVSQNNCEDLHFRNAFQLCIARVEHEVGRIGPLRDKNLVPELIRIAEKREYGYGFLRGKSCEKMRREFLQQICRMRFLAIYALGEIKDPQAVEPLLALLDEPPPSFAEPTEGLLESCAMPMGGQMGFTCAVALEALVKMDVPQAKAGLVPELLQALEEIKDEPIREFDQNFYEAARAGCKVGAASVFGSTALDAMVEKFQEPDTSEAKKEAILNSISKIRDPKAIPKLKELLHHPEWDPMGHGTQGTLGYAAAKALAGMALPELISEYIWMSENEYSLYVEQGCKALGKINDPSTVKYLIKVLKNENDRDDSYAAFALKEMGPIAREAVSTLIEGLNSCDTGSCLLIARALGAIGDESAVPELLQFVMGIPISGEDDAVYALKAIGTDSAVEALKKIIIWEGHEKITSNLSKENYTRYRIARNAAVDSLWNLRGEQENSLFCSLRDDPDIYPGPKNYCKNN